MELIIVDGDDWKGLYVNGKLYTDGHNIRPEYIINAINDNIDQLYEDNSKIIFKSHNCDYDWIEEAGNFPEKLEDVVLEEGDR